MNSLSRNQKFFGLITLVLSLLFFYLLYKLIKDSQYDYIIGCSSLFGSFLLMAGFILGYNDEAKDEKIPLGFGYQLVTYVIVNIVGLVSMFIYMGITIQNILIVVSTLTFWGIGLGTQYYFGIHKKKQSNSDLLETNNRK